MRGEIGRVIEQHITQTPAQHDAQGRPQEQIVDLPRGRGRPIFAPERGIAHQPFHIPKPQDQACNVSQGIPSRLERTDGEGHRINVGKRQFAAHEHRAQRAERPGACQGSDERYPGEKIHHLERDGWAA